MAQYLLNGKVATHIELADRGLQYGDGFFTTIRVVRGQLQLWSLHWQRLTEAAQRLGFPPFETLCSEQSLLAHAAHLLNLQAEPTATRVLRITVTRGAGGRGYSAPTAPQCNVLVAVSDMPTHYTRWREQGISLMLSPLRLGDQPMLNGLKTLNRLEQVVLKQALARQQLSVPVEDLLVCDQRGFVAESTAANVLWCKNGTWYSPALNHGGVKGVMLQSLGAQLPLVKGDYPLEHMLEADQVLICNALMGAVRVQRLVIDSSTERHFSVLSEDSDQLIRRICENE